MRSLSILLGGLTLAVDAAPKPWTLGARQAYNTTIPASLPQNDPNPEARAAAVAERDAGFIYGPSLIGEAAFFPNGTLGNARTQSDMDLWALDRAMIDERIAKDVASVQAALAANGGLRSVDDYARVLYDGQWTNSNPLGPTPGIMTNYTQDLLFSMERLSLNPYPLRLVRPEEPLPFEVPDDQTTEITGVSLEDLKASGSLFYVDHSYQSELSKTTLEPARYGAACSAYFYIHPESRDFLPLAIKTNTGADLIYTPLDTEEDWLLAKMMFNVNDMFDGQMFHLVASHDVSEAVHQAALHTLSENHPIMVVLERLMTMGYSSRIVGEQLCFNPGGHWDQLMYVDNTGCRTYVTNTWSTSGAFRSNYLTTDLQTRGLLSPNNTHPFKTFPFYADASRIRAAYSTFFAALITSYYPAESDLAADFEVRNWWAEASGPAGVQDFPAVEELSRDSLAEVLAHFGYLVSVVHHALNGGDPIGSKATLPFHASALFAPLPEEKGVVTDLMPFLPSAAQAVHYVGFIASFNRPFYGGQARTLKEAFAGDEGMLGRLNAETRRAAEVFLGDMEGLSGEVGGRGFDEGGLSEGMPFVYRALDPGYIPFFCAV